MGPNMEKLVEIKIRELFNEYLITWLKFAK